MCWLRNDLNMDRPRKRKRSRIPVRIGRQDGFKAKRKKLDMSPDSRREDEVPCVEDNPITLYKVDNKSPTQLYDNNRMLESFGGFLIFLSKKCQIMFVSEQVKDILGFEQVDMISQPVSEFVSPSNVKLIQQQLHLKHQLSAKQKNVQNGNHDKVDPFLSPREFYVQMKVKSKHSSKHKYLLTKWTGKVKVRSSSRKSSNQSADGLVCICHPVVSSSILDIRMEGNMFITRHDLELKFIFCEQRIVTLIGYEPSELLGKAAYHFHNPHDANRTSSCHSNLIVKGKSTTKYRFLGKNGNWIWLQTSASIISNHQKEPQYIVCMNYVISPEEGEKFLKTEEKQNGYQNSQIQGYIDLTNMNKETPNAANSSVDSSGNLSSKSKKTTSCDNDMSIDLSDHLFDVDFTTQSSTSLALTNNEINTSTVILTQNTDPFLCSTNCASATLPESQQTLLENVCDMDTKMMENLSDVASKNIEGASDMEANFDMLDDLLEDIEQFTSVGESQRNLSTPVCHISPLSITETSSESQDANLLSPGVFAQKFQMKKDILPKGSLKTCDLDLNDPIDLKPSEENMEVDNKLPESSVLPVKHKSPKHSEDDNSCHITECPSTLFLHPPSCPESCQSSSVESSQGSLLRSLLYRDKSPPRIKETSSLSSLAHSSSPSSISSAQSKSTSFYLTSPSPSSRKSLLSAVLEGNATLNIPTCKKTINPSFRFLNRESSMNIQRHMSQTYKQKPKKTTFCSHGHSCQAYSPIKYQSLDVKTFSDLVALNNEKNRVNNSNTRMDDNINRVKNSSERIASSFSRELPDDLLDLSIQYCDGLAEDQTLALLEEFGEDIWSNSEDLFAVTGLKQLESDPAVTPQDNCYSSNHLKTCDMDNSLFCVQKCCDASSKSFQTANQYQKQDCNSVLANNKIDYNTVLVNKKQDCNSVSANQKLHSVLSSYKADYNIVSTNQKSPSSVSADCDQLLDHDQIVEDKSKRQNENLQQSSTSCCQIPLPTGLQSPTVSSTQVGKIMCRSPASGIEEPTSFSDFDADISDDSNELRKPSKSCQSIGVQTTYTNHDETNTVANTLKSSEPSNSQKKRKMSELEQHLRGYKNFNLENPQKSPSVNCAECCNIEKFSKVTPFLHKLLTGQISCDVYHQLDQYLLKTENDNRRFKLSSNLNSPQI